MKSWEHTSDIIASVDQEDKDSSKPVELVKEAIAFAIPRIWLEGYVQSKENDREGLELETLGVLVSKYCEWSGNLILEVAIAALEDANFRTEAQRLKEMLVQLIEKLAPPTSEEQ